MEKDVTEIVKRKSNWFGDEGEFSADGCEAYGWSWSFTVSGAAIDTEVMRYGFENSDACIADAEKHGLSFT